MQGSESSDNQRSSYDPIKPVVELLQGGEPDAICLKYGISREALEKLKESFLSSRRQMALAEHFSTQAQVGRNEPCPCGSGKKYKKCCLHEHEEARKSIPQDQLHRMEELAAAKEKLEKDVEKGFDLLFSEEYEKAGRFASRLMELYPEDDRLHDIVVNVSLASGDYDRAFHLCRRRWQVAGEEKEFYQENGYHKREGVERKQLVHFYSPSTWLEKFWIASRARKYREMFPVKEDQRLLNLAEGLKVANDGRRFSGRQEEGFEMRREALAPVLTLLKAEMPAVIPFLLPFTYNFSWASLFIPELLRDCGSDDCVRLLAELSMFRFPYFAQRCLEDLEELGERAIPQIQKVLESEAPFDELKVGLIQVLGAFDTPDSFAILAKFSEHDNPYVVNWVAQALGRQKNPAAMPYLEKARERVGSLSKIAGAISEIARGGGQG